MCRGTALVWLPLRAPGWILALRCCATGEVQGYRAGAAATASTRVGFGVALLCYGGGAGVPR